MNRAYFAGDYYLGNNATGYTNIVSSPVAIAGNWVDYCASIISGTSKRWFLVDSSGICYFIGRDQSGAGATNVVSTTDYTIPISIARPGSYKQALSNTSSSSYFIDGATGNIWASGLGTSGALGNNTTTGVLSPVSIARPGSYSVIVAYNNTAVTIDAATGMVWGWGVNTSGQLGDNTVANKSSPVSCARPGSYSSVALGLQHLLMIDAANGSIWATGSNSGQLGDNTTSNRSSPVPCTRPGSYKMIAAGASASAAIDATDGSLWVWGFNSNGILGNNSLSSVSSPVSFARPGSYAYVYIGSNAIVAIDASNGSLWASGLNVYGQLGDGTTVTRSSPVSVLGNRSYVSAKAGVDSIIAMTADGTVYTWGYDDTNQLGRQAVVNTKNIIPVLSTLGFTKIQNNVFLDANGNVYCSGTNGVGSLGDNSNTDSSTLVSIARPGSYKDIACTNSSTFDTYTACAAIDGATGSIVTWGYNHIGQLGDVTTTSKSSPVAIARPGSYIKVSGSELDSHFVAIDAATGMVWGWGSNSLGGLGDRTTTNKSSPVSCARPGSYSQVIAHGFNTLMIDASNGSIWSCGTGISGVLGDNTTAGKSSPVSLARPGSYCKISGNATSGYAIDASDGSVWAWGLNSSGQLGDGTTTTRYSPVSVLGGRSYVDVVGVASANVYLLTADSVVYASGSNSSGQFGDGTYNGCSSPIALPFSNVLSIHKSFNNNLILTIDATTPVVDTQPTSAVKIQGETATFSVVAHGNPTL